MSFTRAAAGVLGGLVFLGCALAGLHAVPELNAGSTIAARHMPGGLDSLVEAERAFARASLDEGTRAAFLHFLADDSIVFRPRPTPGRASYAEQPSGPGVLFWQPEFADISSAGDLGYTTGPWEFRKNSSESSDRIWGHYVSVWRREPGEGWRVVMDIGVPHERAEVRPVRVSRPPRISKPARKAATPLEDAEQRFWRAMAAGGPPAAYREFAGEDIRLYRFRHLPFVGKPAALRAVSGAPRLAPVAENAITKSKASGDLGYAWGTAREFAGSGEPAAEFSAARIWKLDPAGRWRIVVDVLVPIPPGQ